MLVETAHESKHAPDKAAQQADAERSKRKASAWDLCERAFFASSTRRRQVCLEGLARLFANAFFVVLASLSSGADSVADRTHLAKACHEAVSKDPCAAYK